MKWDKSTKKIFSLFGSFGQKLFSSEFEVVVVGGGGGLCEKSHLNQKCRNFMKWINPLKKFVSLFGPFWLRKFLVESLRWWWGVCVKNHTWTKNAGNFMKWINPLKKKKKFFSLFGPSGLRWFEGHVISNVFQTFSIRVDFIRWSKWGMTTITNYKSQHVASYLFHIIFNILQTFTIRLNFIRQSKWEVTNLH